MEVDRGAVKALELKERGNDCMAGREYSKAVELYTQGLSMEGLSDGLKGRLLVNRGCGKCRLGKYEEGLKDVNRALDMEGGAGLVGGWLRKGECLEGLGKWEEAGGCYEMVGKLDKGRKKEMEKRMGKMKRGSVGGLLKKIRMVK